MATVCQSPAEKKHIESVPGRCGGKPCIVGHLIRVQDVVEWTEQGQSPADIVKDFPQLSLADVHAALAYYFDHQAEMDQQRKEAEAFAEAVKAQDGPGPLTKSSENGTTPLSLEQWLHEFDAWVSAHKSRNPRLDDSRESIYPDRW